MKPATEYRLVKLILSLPDGVRKRLFGEEEIAIRGSALDPHTRTMLRLMQLQKRPTLDEIGRAHGAPAVRRAYQKYYQLGAWSARNTDVATEDVLLPAGNGDMKARLYRPAKTVSDGLLIYIHGGGGVIGDIEAYDYFTRYLANYLGAAVLFPEYRLGPEDPFPAGVEDCLAMTRALPALAQQHRFNPQKVVIGGESAGAMLSVICGHEAGTAGIDVKALWLLFAAYDLADEDTFASMTDYGAGFGLSKPLMTWFANQYFAEGTDRSQPLASPLYLPHLEKLPKCLIRAAEYDPLYDQSPVFRDKVEALGVDVTYRVAKGLTHGYTNLFDLVPAAKAALDEDLDWIRAELAA